MLIRPGWKYYTEEFFYKEYEGAESIHLKRNMFIDKINKGHIEWLYVSVNDERSVSKTEYKKLEDWYQQHIRENKLKRIIDNDKH